ncbi:serine O-acetyltransferase [Porphyromonas levii]|uniref:serine O-acetyltransferase n=1 Tax=Porphyromonas levii TaxID=28114 RepID=UPI00035ED8A4|nr:serine acetyltransferase [Porphyromonas levii]
MMNKTIELIRSDYHRYTGGGYKHSFLRITLTALIGRYNGFTYTFWMRFAARRDFLYPFFFFIVWRLQKRYHIQINPKARIGYGFYIGHGVGLVVNWSATIGNNVNMSQFSTVGTNRGKAATIGDNVYVGPSVCIVGGVHIGNNSSIGAGAVVVKDVPENATVGGVPAKVLSYNNPGQYINNRWEHGEE